MKRSFLAAAAILALAAFSLHGARKHWAGTPTLVPANAQVPCPGPVLRFLDPLTGRDVTHIDFGSVPVGQRKVVQVVILNPPGSPCNLTITETAGAIHIEGRLR